MNFELALLPDRTRPKNYQPLIQAVIEASKSGKGEWVRVDGNEIAGKTGQQKQAAVGQAAKVRGFSVETSWRGGFCYVRLLSDEVSQVVAHA